MSGLWLVSYVLLWVVILAVAVLLISVLRNMGVMYASLSRAGVAGSGDVRPSNLTGGDPLPDASLTAADLSVRRASEFRGAKTAFAIVSPTCGGCETYLSHIRHAGPDPLDLTMRDFVVISLGAPGQTADLLRRVGINGDTTVLYDVDGDVARQWGIRTTPGMVIVDEDMVVVRQVFGGKEIADLRKADGGHDHDRHTVPVELVRERSTGGATHG